MNLKTKAIFKTIGIVLITAFLVYVSVFGIGTGKLFSASKIKQGLDLAGGVSITYEAVTENPTDEEMEDAQYKLQLRADTYSTEAQVYREGTKRITVEIPGVQDADKILTELGNPGALYFIYGDGNVKYDSETGEFSLVYSIDELSEKGEIILTGSDVTDAKAGKQQSSGYVTTYDNIVELYFSDEGAEKFGIATTNSIGKTIAIVYDNEVVSVATVQSAITGGVAQITGQKTYEEASILASTIRIGALPIELKEIRSNVVGAQLGDNAIKESLIAGIVGFLILILFMIAYYRIPGLAASIALTIYVGLMVFCLNVFDVTLTLQGIAGIILSVGMAVDANVIIFQRIREELGRGIGLTPRSAIKNGFKKAFSSILDGNVTTLIAAAVLYFMASGGVKGFAVTLAIGIVLSMFTALTVTRFILNTLYELGFSDDKFYGVTRERKPIPFVKNCIKFVIVAGIVILTGFVTMGVNKAKGNHALNYGLDFSGGTQVSVTLPDNYTDNMNSELSTLVSNTISHTSQITRVSGENTYVIKTSELTQEERNLLITALSDTYGVSDDLINTENISGSVSNEMKAEALKAVIIAVCCMLIYIWFRFKNFNFAFSAVLALMHDVLIVLTLYAIARISVGTGFIACMLTIVGYSINATIVIFDRMRENLAAKLDKETNAEIVDRSITQTLSRSINTSLTTFIMVLSLVIFGGDSIREFAVPLMCGIVAGMFSSICLTGPVWNFMEARFKTKKEEDN